MTDCSSGFCTVGSIFIYVSFTYVLAGRPAEQGLHRTMARERMDGARRDRVEAEQSGSKYVRRQDGDGDWRAYPCPHGMGGSLKGQPFPSLLLLFLLRSQMIHLDPSKDLAYLARRSDSRSRTGTCTGTTETRSAPIACARADAGEAARHRL